MEPVLVPREKLIRTIELNRAKHISTFETAKQGWKKKQAEALKKFYAKVAKAIDAVLVGQVMPSLTTPYLIKPESYVKKYDEVIGMLKMSIEPNVKLDAADYNRYIRDNWEWSAQFANSTVGYGGGGGGGGAKAVLPKKRKA